MSADVVQMLVISGIIVGTILITVLARKAREKGLIDSDDLAIAIVTLNLTLKFVDEMNLKDEKDIKLISNSVLRGLNYATIAMSGDYSELIEVAENFAIDSCKASGIEITESREQLIKQLTEIGLKNQVVK